MILNTQHILLSDTSLLLTTNLSKDPKNLILICRTNPHFVSDNQCKCNLNIIMLCISRCYKACCCSNNHVAIATIIILCIILAHIWSIDSVSFCTLVTCSFMLQLWNILEKYRTILSPELCWLINAEKFEALDLLPISQHAFSLLPRGTAIRLPPQTPTMGYSMWNSYTPCGRFTMNLPQVECDFQMDWHIEQLYLKVTPPLCNILVKGS